MHSPVLLNALKRRSQAGEKCCASKRPASSTCRSVGALGSVAAEGDWVLHLKASDRITIVVDQAIQPELANDLLGLGQDCFSPYLALDVGLAVLLGSRLLRAPIACCEKSSVAAAEGGDRK